MTAYGDASEFGRMDELPMTSFSSNEPPNVCFEPTDHLPHLQDATIAPSASELLRSATSHGILARWRVNTHACPLALERSSVSDGCGPTSDEVASAGTRRRSFDVHAHGLFVCLAPLIEFMGWRGTR